MPRPGIEPGRLRDKPTLYRVAIKAGLYRKAVQACQIPPIPGDMTYWYQFFLWT